MELARANSIGKPDWENKWVRKSEDSKPQVKMMEPTPLQVWHQAKLRNEMLVNYRNPAEFTSPYKIQFSRAMETAKIQGDPHDATESTVWDGPQDAAAKAHPITTTKSSVKKSLFG